ncbi:MAG: hypothetical protein WAM89_02700 [Terriglobales bacterium]
MKTIAKILGGLAASALLVSCDGDQTNWGGVIFGFVLAFAGYVLNMAADSQEQVRKDDEADDLVRSVLAGKERFYYMYLRPFRVTNKIRLRDPGARRRPIQDSFKPEPVRTFEAVLDRALRAYGIPLVGLGRPGEAIGAGRITTTDENWQVTFEALAQAASGFIVVPALTSGTLWEVDWLVQHKFIHKTVFIIPANASQEAKEYAKLGLRFPEDGAKGILKLSETGDVIARRSLDLLWAPGAGLAIQAIKLFDQTDPLDNVRSTASPVSPLIPSLIQNSSATPRWDGAASAKVWQPTGILVLLGVASLLFPPLGPVALIWGISIRARMARIGQREGGKAAACAIGLGAFASILLVILLYSLWSRT